jgi:steroid 5-alpha reductase family enzyme
VGKSLKGLVVIVVVTAVILAFGFFAGAQSVELGGWSAFFLCAVLALAVNWIAFVPSAIAQSDKFYDTVGAITYFSVTALACYAAYNARGGLDTRAIVVAAMVAVWCIRLGSFLFIRIHAKGGTDSRFEKIKTNPVRFLTAWTLQALWVTLTASAALAVITTTDPQPLGAFFWIGAAIWLVGILFESVADAQKSAFKADPANKGDFIDVGLWRWSRHPNYFGEITLWTGILVIAIPVLSGLSWLVVVSPVFVYLLLTRISGINLQEEQAKERWGDDPEYREYRRRTPVLFPRPPAEGSKRASA